MVLAGIMTGTSVDAIDIAVCEITAEGDRETISLLSFHTYPFSDYALEVVQKALAGQCTMEELSDVPFLLAKEFARCITELPAAPEAIAVHGQTLWHHPPHSTWQAVSGPGLSALTRLPVVHDFRSADVALGGQGAPLVPIFDYATLAQPETTVVAVNLGGMANITILPAGAKANGVVAFDTGPGNMWIDTAVRVTFGMRYDAFGNVARAGRVLKPMLYECLANTYFNQPPPKSTGRELFSVAEAERLIKKYSHPSSPLEDAVTTVTELTAITVADHIARFAPDAGSVVISGGGSQNTFLVERITELLSGSAPNAVVSIHPQWDAKEAMAFAYLGWRTLCRLPGNLSSVTGAASEAVLGSVANVFPLSG